MEGWQIREEDFFATVIKLLVEEYRPTLEALMVQDGTRLYLNLDEVADLEHCFARKVLSNYKYDNPGDLELPTDHPLYAQLLDVSTVPMGQAIACGALLTASPLPRGVDITEDVMYDWTRRLGEGSTVADQVMGHVLVAVLQELGVDVELEAIANTILGDASGIRDKVDVFDRDPDGEFRALHYSFIERLAIRFRLYVEVESDLAVPEGKLYDTQMQNLLHTSIELERYLQFAKGFQPTPAEERYAWRVLARNLEVMLRGGQSRRLVGELWSDPRSRRAFFALLLTVLQRLDVATHL